MTEPTPSCITCGYSLANIDREGVCPECATPVRSSASVKHLHDSSVVYLRSVRSGVWLQIGAVVAVVGASALRAEATNPSAERAVALISLGCSLIGVLGAWLISSPDPARSADEKFGSLLSCCRAWALTDAGAQCAGAIVGMFVQGVQEVIVTGISQLPAFGTLICVAKIFADLGSRAGDTKLAACATKLVKVNVWMLGGSVALLVLPLVPKPFSTIASGGIGIYMLVFGIMFLIYYIKSIVGILRCLKAAVKHAHARESSAA